MEQIFFELIVVLILATGVSALMKLLKQPLIIGYIITGILASPYFLNIVKSTNAITAFAEIGLVLLLFLVGLNLNPGTVKDIGKVSLFLGLGQIIFTAVIGFIVMLALGFSTVTSIYVAVALTFSSTIIVMKLLADKNDSESLYGRLSMSLLIVQDIVAMFVLMIVSASANHGNLANVIFETIIRGFILLTVLFLLGIYIIPSLFKWAAKSQEFLLMFSIAWCLSLAGAFYLFNFSMEVGALLAGLTLAASPYRHEIGSRLRPLRDFFIVMFFILLGSQMVFADITVYILPIIILSLFVLIGNPIIVMVILGMMNYSKRTSFMTGIAIAQISEFSLILLALGVKLGHVSNEILSFVTIVGLITIAGSAYMIMYSGKLYPLLSKYLSVFEKKNVKKKEENADNLPKNIDIILFGYNRIGHDILNSLKRRSETFRVIDFNPETIEALTKSGIPCSYGDANDLELLEELNLKDAKMIISTIPDVDANMLIIKKANSANPRMISIVVSQHIDDSLKLYEIGATHVIMPHFLGGTHTSMLLEKYGLNLEKFLSERIYNIENLKLKKALGHEHPKSDK